jgi:hypothetical protein
MGLRELQSHHQAEVFVRWFQDFYLMISLHQKTAGVHMIDKHPLLTLNQLNNGEDWQIQNNHTHGNTL